MISTSSPDGWILLVHTLPTRNATERMRLWRALKAMGCAVLRDGVYLLPRDGGRLGALQELCGSIDHAGGTAHVLEARSRDDGQERIFRALFDRTAEYKALARAMASTRRSLAGTAPVDIQRALRRIRRELDALRATDFFAGDGLSRAEALWTDLATAAGRRISPEEPVPGKRAPRRLDRREYRGRIWATRRYLWADRVASAWLIRRFIDPEARFAWLDTASACPKHAIGFDFDGATFTHQGSLVTFEVLVASFGLGRDPGLAGLGALVHALDIGGDFPPEAGGFEALLTGARQAAPDDDALLAQLTPSLDALHAYYVGQVSRPPGRRPRKD